MFRDQHQNNPFIFYLIGKPDSYFDQPTYVSFDPNFEKDDFSSSSSSSSSENSNTKNHRNPIIPTFNNDRLSFTPSFYLPSHKIRLEYSQERMSKKEKKYQQIEEEFIMIPKPRKRPYCHCCQIWFSDYLEHITEQDHRKKTVSHQMHMQIERLCVKFNPQEKFNDETEKADELLLQNKLE